MSFVVCVCVCVCVSAAPQLLSGHVRKGALNQRLLQEGTAVTTHCQQATGTLNSMFTFQKIYMVVMCTSRQRIYTYRQAAHKKREKSIFKSLRSGFTALMER